MNVVSWFDGISGGQQALKKADIKYNYYRAFENDNNCIKITMKNHPDTILSGEVSPYFFNNPRLDCIGTTLFLAGPPCQGFSFAGKNLNFDDPRSLLFFQAVKFLKVYKPTYFLFENVVMKDNCRKILDELVGIKGIVLNSNLVSAQNRERIYWTNIPFNKTIKDKKIFLKDIIESNVSEDYNVTDNYLIKPHPKPYFRLHQNIAMTLESPLCCRDQGRRLTPCGTKRDDENGIICRGYEFRKDGKTNTITTTTRDNSFLVNNIIRKPTPLEFERLQTLPDNYTEGISKSARYHTVGNGWTIDVIAHILKGMNL